MACRGLPVVMARPCAALSAALAGWGPRAAPASPPWPAKKTTMLVFSTRCYRREVLVQLETGAYQSVVINVDVRAELQALLGSDGVFEGVEEARLDANVLRLVLYEAVCNALV